MYRGITFNHQNANVGAIREEARSRANEITELEEKCRFIKKEVENLVESYEKTNSIVDALLIELKIADAKKRLDLVKLYIDSFGSLASAIAGIGIGAVSENPKAICEGIKLLFEPVENYFVHQHDKKIKEKQDGEMFNHAKQILIESIRFCDNVITKLEFIITQSDDIFHDFDLYPGLRDSNPDSQVNRNNQAYLDPRKLSLEKEAKETIEKLKDHIKSIRSEIDFLSKTQKYTLSYDSVSLIYNLSKKLDIESDLVFKLFFNLLNLKKKNDKRARKTEDVDGFVKELCEKIEKILGMINYDIDDINDNLKGVELLKRSDMHYFSAFYLACFLTDKSRCFIQNKFLRKAWPHIINFVFSLEETGSEHHKLIKSQLKEMTDDSVITTLNNLKKCFDTIDKGRHLRNNSKNFGTIDRVVNKGKSYKRGLNHADYANDFRNTVKNEIENLIRGMRPNQGGHSEQVIQETVRKQGEDVNDETVVDMGTVQEIEDELDEDELESLREFIPITCPNRDPETTDEVPNTWSTTRYVATAAGVATAIMVCGLWATGAASVPEVGSELAERAVNFFTSGA